MKVVPIVLLLGVAVTSVAIYGKRTWRDAPRLSTGKQLATDALGTDATHIEVGSYPLNSILGPDGKYVILTNTGYRQQLSVIRLSDSKLVSKVDFGGRGSRGLYFGLAFDANGTLYASRGAEDKVSLFKLSDAGVLEPSGELSNPAPDSKPRLPHTIAGLALAQGLLLTVNNQTHLGNGLKGSLSFLSLPDGKEVAKVQLGGFPYDVVATADGKKAYVSSERDGVIHVVDVTEKKVLREIRTGENPTVLKLSPDGTRILVSNSSSDTLSVIDVATDRVLKTILLRPAALSGLPGSTPLGIAVTSDGGRAFVALADLNAVAIVDLKKGTTLGFLPAGWYPTSVTLSPDGKKLLVTNAKGNQTLNPNGKPVRPEGRGQYVLNILEGTASVVDVPGVLAKLDDHTAAVLAANFATRADQRALKSAWTKPPVEHVIYIVKENRTYDQVLGDLPKGNTDPSLVLFGREVTPNQHAFAERFVNLDNFYVCAEVSADGWNWSTQGIANAYVSRNSVTNYAGRGRSYDFEGTNNGVAVDLRGINDVSRAGGGYIWDSLAKKGVSYRNYGFFLAFDGGSDDKRETEYEPDNAPNKKALQGKTSPDFRRYDTSYPDSDAFLKHGLEPAPRQQLKSGKFNDPARVVSWEREFQQFVKNGNLPRFQMLRLGRDHTAGTSAGQSSPRAMVADNDYAVGRIVEAVSNSPYWNKTAIFILEDDAQAGFDHVDSHRSIGFVVSPYIKPNSLDSRFYNTDSMLRTMAAILGVEPWNQNVAAAPLIDVFSKSIVNPGPYQAILPPKNIVGEVNGRSAYRSADSTRLLNRYVEESLPDIELNDILWGSIKGAKTPRPNTPRAIWRVLKQED